MKKFILLFMCLIIVGCGVEKNHESKLPDQEKSKDTTVSFVGVGDNLIHEVIYNEADCKKGKYGDGKYDFSSMYEPVKKDIQYADLAYIDQESIVGGDELEISGYPTFNCPKDMAADVVDTGFDIINTANNHSLDKYQLGINNSADIWSKFPNIISAGTYVSQQDRDTIRVIERKGIKFSFLAYTYGTNGIMPPNDYSVAYFDDEQIKKDVVAAKKISDVIIVSAHWGDENVHEINDFQKHYAQLFADLGVDVVVGEHPHVIQPVSWITGKNGNKMLVVYSLGNFLSGMLEVDNVLGGMIQFDFVQNYETKKITVENVIWEPLITHYTGDSTDIISTRKNFAVYKLKDYTPNLAKQHGLNGVDGQHLNIDDLYKKTQKIITEVPISK